MVNIFLNCFFRKLVICVLPGVLRIYIRKLNQEQGLNFKHLQLQVLYIYDSLKGLHIIFVQIYIHYPYFIGNKANQI